MAIKIWDGPEDDGSSLLREHSGDVTSVAWSTDGQRLASTGDDRTIKIWNMETEEALVSFCGHTGVVNSVDFSPDGR